FRHLFPDVVHPRGCFIPSLVCFSGALDVARFDRQDFLDQGLQKACPPTLFKLQGSRKGLMIVRGRGRVLHQVEIMNNITEYENALHGLCSLSDLVSVVYVSRGVILMWPESVGASS